jgi:hypothetical protein
MVAEYEPESIRRLCKMGLENGFKREFSRNQKCRHIRELSSKPTSTGLCHRGGAEGE